ncbi:uncharacterized protein N0V89_010244 [Didymosphaeria variabile]|uniref:Heterokaryon incompatibility domain-containing protein n=1 Tax=Didymosphaeria variabile TaxID=1932322 RepID=A0A9W8XFB9_9PLEO|nr:uncharacterized protein N0V89_010244 [Didymosphaeria variabile]KAJ4348865.1 hypothetical protein N0V89_010244 [Didymosphaeria variabile]
MRRCSRFQDDIGALIHQNRLVYGEDQTEAAHTSPRKAPDLSTYCPSHEAVLFHNIEELRAAYNTPCPLCRRVFKCIDRGDWASLKTFKAVRTVLMLEKTKGKPTLKAMLDTDPPIKSIRMTAKNPVKSTRKLNCLGEYLKGLEHQDPLVVTLQECARLENDSTGSAASLEMARFWLEECLVGHPNCARDNLGWLPTRVIDIGDADGKDPPRLLETADLPSSKSESSNTLVFVALSHCWGSKQIITTTTSTLADRKRGIDFRDLSKTFQDAVVTTHRLGLRYLWIDSLCIIQDSVDDWMKESVQMCTIYERALFTIMAAHASGGDKGCFVTRDGLAGLPLTLRFNAPDKSEAWDACFQLPDHGQGLMPKFNPVLFTRAWVLQEQFNSRAKLIFFGEQVHWECVTMSGSEQRPLDGKKIWDVIGGSMTLVADNCDDSVNDAYHGLEWYELVKNYTRRGITKSSDRLIAIDGIAQSVQTRTSDRYIAGLWAQGLPLGFMWYIPWTLAKSGPWHALEKEAKTYLSSRHEQVFAPSWYAPSQTCRPFSNLASGPGPRPRSP